MPRPKVHGLESYKDIPIDHPLRRKIQNRNAQRTFRKKRAANNAQDQPSKEKQQQQQHQHKQPVPPPPTAAQLEQLEQTQQPPPTPVTAVDRTDDVEAEGPLDSTWDISGISSPNGINPDLLLQPSDQASTIDLVPVDPMESTADAMSQAGADFTRPTSRLDTGFLDPVDLYTNHGISSSGRFSPPFPIAGDTSHIDHFMDTEWQPTHEPPRRTSADRQSSRTSSRKSPKSHHSKVPINAGSVYHALQDPEYPVHSRRQRLDALNSPCPSVDGSSRVATAVSAIPTTSSAPIYDLQSQQQHLVSPPTPSMFLPQGLLSSESRETISMLTNRPISTDTGSNMKRPKSGSRTTTGYTKTRAYTGSRDSRNNSVAYSMAGSSMSADTTSFGGRLSEAPSTTSLEDCGGTMTAESSVSGGSSSTSPKSDQGWRHVIHTCCEVGHTSLVEELLDSGLDIDKQDSAGNTPLHIAASAGHDDVMALLLQRGCNVNAVNHAGWTAAHLATVKGHRRCLRLLLELNASPWAKVNTSSM